MKYFAVILTMKDVEKSKFYRPDHLAFLTEMRSEKKVLMNGRFVDGAGGLIIYIGKDLEEAELLVNKDPYIINGARNYEIHEWEIVADVDFD